MGKYSRLNTGASCGARNISSPGGTVLPVISQLLKVTRDVGATDTELALWMIAPFLTFR